MEQAPVWLTPLSNPVEQLSLHVAGLKEQEASKEESKTDIQEFLTSAQFAQEERYSVALKSESPHRIYVAFFV